MVDSESKAISLAAPPVPEAIQAGADSRGIRKRLTKWLREFLAIWIWLYVVLKLFVFDFDLYLINALAPHLRWVIEFKFLILLAVLAAVSLISKNKSFYLFIAFIAFYPLIVLTWRLPWLVLKQKSWVLFFTLANFVISFFQSIKYTIVSAAIYIICFTVILFSDMQPQLYVSATGLLVVLSASFYRRFLNFFLGDKLFRFCNRAVPWTRSKASGFIRLDENIRKLPVANMDEQQVAKWKSSLEFSVLLNRILLFSARKVREHQRSSFGVALGVITTIFLWLGSVITFTAINFAMYKIDPAAFLASGPPTLFTFFHYSFKAMLFTTINELTPVAPIAQIIGMLNNFFGVLTVVIVASALIAVRGQRYNAQLDDLISTFEHEGREAEEFVRSEFRLSSIDDAIAELTRLQSSVLTALVQLTEKLK